MIRSVLSQRPSRMGQQMIVSQGCISYQDPDTGLYLADPGTPCDAGDGSGPDSPLPSDPGAQAALSDYTASQMAQQNSLILNTGLPATINQTSQAATGLGLPGVIPSPFTFPSWVKWAVLAGVGLVVVESVSGGRGRR